MKTKTLILIAALFILFSCKKEELIEQPKNYECKVYTVQKL